MQSLATNSASTVSHPSLLSRTFKFEELDRNEPKYKDTVFWTKTEWTQFINGKSGVTILVSDENENNSAYRYCTDINGQMLSADEIASARAYCRSIFNAIDRDPDSKPPATWARGATPAQCNYLRLELETKFPWLKLCAHGWKSQQLAIDLLPNYRQKHPAQPPCINSMNSSPEQTPTASDSSIVPSPAIPACRNSLDIADGPTSSQSQPPVKKRRVEPRARPVIQARNPLYVVSLRVHCSQTISHNRSQGFYHVPSRYRGCDSCQFCSRDSTPHYAA